MARVDLETAFTAMTAYTQDHTEPKEYRDLIEEAADRVERILFPIPDQNHRPVRGDQVDMWLRGWRDQFQSGSPERKVINDIIDEYQRRASLGLSMIDPMPNGAERNKA